MNNMNNHNNNDWLEAIKQKAQNATREVPNGTWEGIAKSLQQQAPATQPRIMTRLWKPLAAAAAVAIAVTAGFFIFSNDDKTLSENNNQLAENTPTTINTGSDSSNKQENITPQQQDIDQTLLAQDNTTQSQPVAPITQNAVSQRTKSKTHTRPHTDMVPSNDLINNELLANSFNEIIDLTDYPNEFNPENYYYDIETMLALEELYAQYDNAMNQDAMEPWKNYIDSTYQQHLVYDANARKLAREQMALTKPGKKPTMLMAAYGNGLISTDRNSTINSSSAPMLAPSSTPSMMLAPAAPGLAPATQPVAAPPVNYDYHHHMPLTFGVTFTKRIVGNLYGNVGLNFTMMTSDVTPDNGGSQFKQDIKLIGLPFGVRWNFWRYKGLTTFVGGEGMVERVVDASFGNEDVTIKRLQWSVHATAGAQYNFTKHVGIYLQPKLSHYITTMPLNTLRNEHPFNFNLQMGLTFDF